MPYITIARPPYDEIERFDEVMAAVGDEPDGLESRWVGTDGDGHLRVIAVWASKGHADRFMAERLGPAFARVLGPDLTGAPEHVGVEAVRTYRSELVG